MDIDAERATIETFYEERDRKATERKLGDVREVLRTPQGRRVYWGLMSEAGVFRASYVKGDPHGTTHNEGKRDIGQKLLDDLMVAKPEAFAQMQREHVSEGKQLADEESRALEKIKEA